MPVENIRCRGSAAGDRVDELLRRRRRLEQRSDVRPEKGLYQRLVARGSMQRLLTDDEVTRAMSAPPADTRAFFRGECLRRYPGQVAAASWDSVVFDLGRENLVRIPTMEPLRGTREHVGALFEASATAQELVDTITGG